MAKDMNMLKKIISTSEWHEKHPFASQNTLQRQITALEFSAFAMIAIDYYKMIVLSSYELIHN